MALGSWLSEILHKAGGPVAAVAAVAAGQPELAVAAYQAGNSLTAKKPSQPQAVVAAPVAIGQNGFVGAYESLTPVDREIVLVGGAVVGAAVLYKLLFAPSGRR